MTDLLDAASDFFKSFDLLNFVAVIISIILYFLSYLQPQNSLYIPFESSFVNFPKGNGISADNKFIGYFFISYPFILFILKMISKTIHWECFHDLKFFSCLWTSFTSIFLTMAISNFLCRFIGFPTPNFYAECGQNQFNTCKKSTLIKFALFKSYPSLEASYKMAMFMSFAFTFHFFCPIFNPIYIIFFGFAFYAGANRIKVYQNHPTDITVSILIGFAVSYYLWGKKKPILSSSHHHNASRVYN